MTSTADNPTYQRGQDAARQAIERSVSLGEFATEQQAAKHHLYVAVCDMEPDLWSKGWISYCEEVADQ